MSAWRAWLLGWLGMAGLALLNGTFRALVTQPWLGEEVARRVATMMLLVVLAAYVAWLHRRCPLASAGFAWKVGLAWVGMTLAFEFGFGRFVEGLAWTTMLADYDLSRGRIWLLVPIVTAVLPRIVLALSPTHVPPRGADRVTGPGATGSRARSSRSRRCGSAWPGPAAPRRG